MTARQTARQIARSTLAFTLFAGVVVALLGAAGLASASPAVTETAAPSTAGHVTWGVRTAANDNGADRANFAYSLDPGSHVDDALIVTNHDSEPLELSVYPADGFTTASGQLDLVTENTPSVAVGTWSTLTDDTLQIAPGASVEVPFTVTIPANATPGDYAGGILTALFRPGQEEGITVDRRLGIRMHVRVLGDLAPGLAVEELSVAYAGTLNPFGTGDATVSYTVRNTGNTRLAAGQAVTLTGPWGMLPVDAAGVDAVPELLPGETWAVAVTVDDIRPTFWLTATSVVTPTVPAMADSATEIEAVRSTAGTWAVPWSPLGLLVVVAGGIVIAVFVAKRQRMRRRLAEDERVQAAVDHAIREN